MRYVAIILVIVVVSTAFAADNDFSMKFRGQSYNSTFDQITFYPTYKVGDNVSFGSVLLYAKSSEFSTGFKFSNGSSWVWPLVGVLYNAGKGYGTHFRGSMHLGMETKSIEFVGQNMFDIANKRATDDTYHRWWLQYKLPRYNTRIGFQTEITNVKGKKATVALGPKFSLLKGDYRFDCFYGKIVQYSGVLSTPMTMRIWLYITM